MKLSRTARACAAGIALGSVSVATLLGACGGGSSSASATDGAAPTPSGGPYVPPGADGGLEAITPVASCALPKPANAIGAMQNVAYVKGGSAAQVLDIGYPTPVDPAKTHPIVLFVHGGGWIAGDKSLDDGDAAYLAEIGYVTASTSYRLADAGADRSTLFPAQIQDVRCALRWLRKNAATFGADPSRVAVVGESAGGHLVSLLGTTPNEASFDGACPELGTSPADVAVNAVVDVYGPTDLRHSSDYSAAVSGLLVDLLGTTPEADPAKAALASPITHITASTPPHLILQGTTDALVPVAISERYHAALRAAGVPSTLIELPGVGHAFNELGNTPQFAPTTCTFLAFLKDRLQP